MQIQIPMKFKFFIVLIGLIGMLHTAHAQSDQDVYLHYGAGVATGAAGAFLASELSNKDPFWTFAGAVGGSFLAGAFKEAIDSGRGGKWDNGDLAATVAGGITIGVTIEIFSSKKRKKQRIMTSALDHDPAEPFY